MGFKDGFVANVVCDGSIIEDKNGVAAIPFSSEYQLRLKNKTNRKAVASIYIDGEKATKAGDLIIGANETVEVERFIENLSDGRKFRFVPLDKCDDHYKPFGDIEVKFRLEKERKVTISYPYAPYQSWRSPWRNPWIDPNVTWCSDTTTYTAGSQLCCSASTITNCSSINAKSFSDVSDGKTVKGSYSGQAFNWGYIGDVEYEATVINLKLVGYENKNAFSKWAEAAIKNNYCPQCGDKIETNDKFCKSCGNKINS
jgi:hypothetical protein